MTTSKWKCSQAMKLIGCAEHEGIGNLSLSMAQVMKMSDYHNL